jgi:hypothetical protein
MKLIRKFVVLGMLLGSLGVFSFSSSVSAKNDPWMIAFCQDQYQQCVATCNPDPRKGRQCYSNCNTYYNMCLISF